MNKYEVDRDKDIVSVYDASNLMSYGNHEHYETDIYTNVGHTDGEPFSLGCMRAL